MCCEVVSLSTEDALFCESLLPRGRHIHDTLGVLVSHLIRQHLDQSSLVRAEVLGHVHSELDAEVARAGPAATDTLHALAGQGQLVSRVGPRGHLDIDRAIQRGDGNLSAQKCRRQGKRGCVEDVRSLPTELGVLGDAHKDVEITSLRAGVGVGRLARGGCIARAVDSQSHAVLDTSRYIDLDRRSFAYHTMSGASPALGAPRNSRAGSLAGPARRRHLEAALHKVHPRTCSIASCAGRPLRPRLQTAAVTCPTRNLRREVDRLARPLGGFHKGDAGLDFDIIAHEDLLLEGVRSSTPAPAKRTLLPRESREDILKVEAATETTLRTAEAMERAAAAERVTSGRVSARIEASGAKLVILLLLLGIGEDLVGRLDLAKLLLRRRVLVRVGVELLR